MNVYTEIHETNELIEQIKNLKDKALDNYKRDKKYISNIIKKLNVYEEELQNLLLNLEKYS